MVVAVLAATAGTGQAAPEEPGISIISEGVDGCPGPAELRGTIEARLGRDLLIGHEEGPAATVVFTREGDRVVAQVVLDLEGPGRRIEGSTCASVGRAVALFLVVALGESGEPPAAGDPPPLGDSPGSPGDRPQQADPELPPSVDTAARTAWRFPVPAAGLGVGLVQHAGLLPATGPAAALEASVGGDRWMLALHGRWSAPVSRQMAGGELVASMVALGAGPCLQEGHLRACALVLGGRLAARGEGFTMSGTAGLPHVSAGARVGYEIPLGSHLAAWIHLEAHGTFTRARLAVTGAPGAEWMAPPAWLAAGVSVAGRLRAR